MNEPLFKTRHSTCQWLPFPLTQEGLLPYSTLLSPAPSSCPLSPGAISIIYKPIVIFPNFTKQGRNTADLPFPSSNYCSLFLLLGNCAPSIFPLFHYPGLISFSLLHIKYSVQKKRFVFPFLAPFFTDHTQ